ncbi:hypothetical protein [Streptosporangium sp. NPDC006930]|uniref:hypothetical protein n=1 Tax=Streptosporangium sp. NPDC006930 TaxID=3154783 RepID=UPI00342088DF
MTLADRSVTVRLSADVKPFIAQMAKAEAAAKRLRDGLGDSWEPFEQETRKQKQKAPRQAEEVAGAFMRSFTRHVTAAAKSLPSLQLAADASDAQIKLASLRQGLVDLADKRINVDVSAVAALSELRAIQLELERLGTSAEIDVRADAAAALAQLRVVQREVDRLGGETAQVEVDADSAGAQAKLGAVGSEVSRLNGRKANVAVNADTGRALLGIAAVAAALTALPAVTTVTVGVGVLGGALTAAGLGAVGMAAAAVPAIGRVNEALRETESAAGGAGGAMVSAAQKAAESAASALSMAQAHDRVRDAAHGVRMAQRGVGDALRDVKDRQDALRQAQENAGLVAERVSLAAEAGARRVADAERTAADSHRATQRALEDLTRARERALERLEDLALATEGGALSEERAQISIRRAQADLARVNAPGSGATALDREDAELRVREAEFALKRLKESNADLADEQAKANREGVEGSDEVRAAKEAVEAATRREADAERALGDARAQAARDSAAAQREVRQASDAVARAQRDIGDALRRVADAQHAVSQAERNQLRAKQQLRLELLQQKAAMEQAGGAAGGAASKMSQLSKEEQRLARDIKAFSDEYLDWQRSLQPDIFPTIRSGLTLMTAGMKASTPVIKSSAFALTTLAQRASEGLENEQWTRFFDTMTVMAPKAIDGLGTSMGNLLGGLAGILEAFAPKTDDVLTWLKNVTQEFENWGQGLGDDNRFVKFMDYAEKVTPKVGQLVSNLGQAISNLLAGSADPGAGMLDLLVELSEVLANLTPAQYEAAAKAIGLIVAAIKLGTAIKLGVFVTLAEVLSKLSPGEIEAVALAIAGLVIAAKGYQAVSAAAGIWEKFGGSVDKAGSAAERNKGKLSKLGEAAGAVSGVLAATTALGMLDNSLNGLDTKLGSMSNEMSEFAKTGQLSGKLAEQWGDSLDTVVKNVDSWGEALGRASGTSESFREAISRLANPGPLEGFKTSYLGLLNVVTLGTTEFDKSAEQIGFMDQELANLVANGRAGEAQQAFARFAQEAEAMGVPVGKLKEIFPQYTEAVGNAGIASTAAAVGIDEAKQKMDGLQKSIDTFAGRTDALQAIRNMETAYKDAARAIEAANGKLVINRGMTDQQRDAVILAREKFTGYIESIRLAADGAEKLSGKTGDATLKVVEQLPKLAELAGKSSEAKSQILLLAAAYGISAADAEKAMQGGKGLRDVLAELKSKQIKIDMDTAEAEARLKVVARQLEDLQRRAQLKLVGGDNPTSARGNAWGGIQYADGRPDYMAAGGIRAVGANPSARIATSPQLISGRSGPDVIFAEAGMESFIPLDPAKRTRGLQVLDETARLMGQAVVPMSGAVSNTSSSVSNTASSSTVTNWSRVSRPTQTSHVSSSSATYNTAAGGPVAGPGGEGGGGPAVVVQNMQVREQADIAEVAARISMRRRSRG